MAVADKKTKETKPVSVPAKSALADLQRPSAEALYAEELTRLMAKDAANPKPPGWKLSPKAVLTFVIGDDKQGCASKFVGRRSFVSLPSAQSRQRAPRYPSNSTTRR